MAPPMINAMLAQLGGNQIFAMAFKGCTYSAREDDQRPPSKGPAGMTLAIARPLVKTTKGKATHVEIQLEDDDTYTVSLWRVVNGIGFSQTVIASMSLVYGDQLRETVESMTGLRLTLGTMGATR